jgi:hypothetical protein
VGYATKMMKSNGPSHAVGHKKSPKEDPDSLEGKQCVCADAKRVFKTMKPTTPNPLTQPTSLEMLKNSISIQNIGGAPMRVIEMLTVAQIQLRSPP